MIVGAKTAAQVPIGEVQAEACELGHIPMAIPIPSGIASSTISTTSKMTRTVFQVTRPGYHRAPDQETGDWLVVLAI